LVLGVIAVALLGPLLSPQSPTAIASLPFETPSGEHWLGTDQLGRDAFARFLHGGLALVLVAFVATVLAYLVGLSVGMAAGYRRGLVDHGTVAVVDVILAFPPIVLLLVLVAAVGPSLTLIVVGIATIHAPRITRIVRSLTIETATAEYVEAAVARGEPLWAILRKDVLPNIWTPVLADFGLRLTGSVILFASLSYLGLGQAPPAADWGLMISENRGGLLLQPWVVVVPAATIALLTIGVNLVADGVARSIGRSLVERGV
jgi:peptide/nickel transport system permease protein